MWRSWYYVVPSLHFSRPLQKTSVQNKQEQLQRVQDQIGEADNKLMDAQKVSHPRPSTPL